MPEKYKPFPTVSPIEQHRAPTHISVSFPDVRFTDSIGRALGELGQGQQVLGGATRQVGSALAHMGQSVERAGDEIFARATAIKSVMNQTAATEAEVKFRIEADKISDAYEATSGNGATGALDAHMKTLEDLRQRIGGTLNNQQARQAYEQDSLRALGHFVTKAGKHGAAQGKASLIAAEKAQWDLTLNDVYKDPDNPDNERRKEEARQKFINNTAAVMGIKGPVLELELLKRESSYNSSQLTGIAKKDPGRAEAMLAERKDRMMAPDVEKIENSIRMGHLLRGPRVAESEINADLNQPKTTEEREKQLGLAERLKEADRWVDQYPSMKGDVEFKQRVRQAVENGYTQDRQNVADFERRQWGIISRALTGDRTPGVPPPRNWEELRAQGDDVDAAIRALPSKKYRDMIANSFKHNIELGKVKFDPVDSVVNFGRLKGMSSTDPAGFMAATDDIHNPKLGMNETELKQIAKIRQDIQKDPRGDPRIATYHRWLQESFGAELQSLGVYRRDNKNPEEFDAFRGGLMTTVETFIAEKKRAPTREEFMKVIAPEVLKYKPATGFLFWGSSEERPSWSPQTVVPEDWKAKFIADVMSIPGTEAPNEKAIRDAYIKKLFLDSLKKRETATPPKKPAKSSGPEE